VPVKACLTGAPSNLDGLTVRSVVQWFIHGVGLTITPSGRQSIFKPRHKAGKRPRQGAFDHENRKTPIRKPAANAQRPNVQAETTRTRLRRSSCEISWDRTVIAAAPLRWPPSYGENAKTAIVAQKKAIEGRSKFRIQRHQAAARDGYRIVEARLPAGHAGGSLRRRWSMAKAI
jgi:hypothetical protein